MSNERHCVERRMRFIRELSPFARLQSEAKEDIYFAERDRELSEKLRAQLQKVDKRAGTARTYPG